MNQPILITDLSVENDVKSTKYVKLKLLHYEQNGKPLSWEIVEEMDYVCSVVHNIDTKKLILVKQLRPPVYYKYWKNFNESEKIKNCDARNYCSYELCAGLCDKKKTPVQIMQEELEEELGYIVNEEKFQKITEFYDIGISGKRGILYYVEVREINHFKQKGGGLEEEGEIIEKYEIDANEKSIMKLLKDDTKIKSVSTTSGLHWYLYQQLKEKGNKK